MSWLILLLQALFLFFYLPDTVFPKKPPLSGDLIFFDEMDFWTAENWTYGGDVVVPSFNLECSPQFWCFELNGGGWVERTFSTQGYHTVYFTFNTDASGSGTLDIQVFDLDVLITDTSKSITTNDEVKTVTPSFYDLWDDISFFKIRFAVHPDQNSAAFIDRLSIFGDPIISSPTAITAYPTTSTLNPTTYPTIVPTLYPSMKPTTMNPTQQPTDYNVIVPHTSVDHNEHEHDVGNEFTTPAATANSKDHYTEQSDAILSDKYLVTHWYYLVLVAAIFLCLLCTIAMYCAVCNNQKVLKLDQATNGAIINQLSATENAVHVAHIHKIALQKMEHDEQTSLPSTQVTIATSPSPSPSPKHMFPMITPNGLTDDNVTDKNDEKEQHYIENKQTNDCGEEHRVCGLAKLSYDAEEEYDDDDGLYDPGADFDNGMEEVYITSNGQTFGVITAGTKGVNVPENTDTDEGSEEEDFSNDDIVQNKNITQQ